MHFFARIIAHETEHLCTLFSLDKPTSSLAKQEARYISLKMYLASFQGRRRSRQVRNAYRDR